MYQTVDEYLQIMAPKQRIGELGRKILADLILEGIYPKKDVLADILLLDAGKASPQQLLAKALAQP